MHRTVAEEVQDSYRTWFVQNFSMIISILVHVDLGVTHRSIHYTRTFHFFINFVNVELVYRVNCQ